MPCPFNWEHASLGDIIDLRTGPFGSALHRSDYAFGEVPLINPMHITAGRIAANPDHCVSEDTAKRLSEYRLLEGDIVMGRRGEMGRCAVVGPPYVGSVCGTGSLILRRTNGIYPPFLQYFLSSDQVVSHLQSAAVGSTMANLNQKLLLGISIDIPPTTEQVRIVEKLEELLSDLDAGVAELKAAQKKLALYRQSLLKAAVEGALTADWRARRAARVAPQETGADLLARILTERRTRWEARQLAKFKEQGKTPPKGWQAKYPEPAGPDSAGLPSLPKGWKWGCLDQLITESSYGTSVKCSYESSGPPVLRIPNVVAGSIDLSDLKFATQALGIDQSEFLAPGDLLVVRTNGSVNLVGRAAVVPTSEMRSLYFASYLLRLRCVLPFIIPSWISTFMASIQGRNWIERRAASSAGQHNISLSTLLTMPIPLAPLAEQAATLEALQQETQTIVEQEQATGIALKQSAAQRKNLLKAAFSGQLVPQDPNDEPASALLARIRAEREARSHGNLTRRTRKAIHA